MTDYIRTPFGTDAANRGPIPNDSQPDGSVSYADGFPVPYELDPGTDPDALDVPRLQFNQMMYAYGVAIQAMQRLGFPDHIVAADNGGAPYSYSKNATVRATDGNNYYSLIDANTDVPPSSNWGLVSYSTVTEPTATGKDFWGATLPAGYVWGNGTTIGSAASGATGRANVDTQNLFFALWAALPNSTLPIQTSAGAASTRGISAASDFAANKRLPTPDKRDVASIGKGDMGGTSDRGLITVAGSGIAGTTMGATGGVETVALTGNQNGTHTHVFTGAPLAPHNHTVPTSTNGSGSGSLVPDTRLHNGDISTTSVSAGTPTGTNGNSGLGSAHQNTQPTIVCNYIIKL